MAPKKIQDYPLRVNSYILLRSLFIADSVDRGRGVFTSEKIPKGTIIETSPVIVMGNLERALLDQTLLHDYIFEWGNGSDQCGLVLGYVSVYNHSYQSNCEYEMDYKNELISIKTMRIIKAGEELFINYHGSWDNKKRVWFEAKE